MVPMKLFPLEKAIAKYIREGLSINDIANKILKHSDTMEVGRFLYNSGLIRELFQFAMDQIQHGKSAPWPFVIQSLTDHEITISTQNAKILYKNMLIEQEKENTPYIFACKNWGEDFKEFELFRTVFLEKLQEANFNIKKELLKKLEFVQSQGLLEEEETIINQLLEIESDSKKYLLLKKKIEEKKALQFIKKQKLSHQKKVFHEKKSFSPIPQEDHLKSQLLKATCSIAEKYPKKAKNLAVFLYMMGWPDMGLKLLDITKATIGEAAWFYLEWLFEVQQYTASIELANQLLDSTHGDPEKLFFINYIKAQALYYLGEKKEAIQYLNDIMVIRPDYKSAQSLMEKWLKK